jgi:DNA-binding LytR/AlgR family response regulator
MIEIAICDDDLSITAYLEALLERNAGLLPEPFRVQLFTQGAALLAALPFDIIFLDIKLEDTTGIRVAEEIRKLYENTILVFASAHESYCKDLFRFDTAAFLSKPIEDAHVQELLPRLYKKYQGLNTSGRTFTYRVKDAVCRVLMRDIIFFESKTRQIKVVTQDKQDLFYGKLDELELSLNHPGFMRIHQSFLVNLDKVDRFTSNTLILSGDYVLPIAQRKQKETHQKIMDYYNAGKLG